MPTPEEQKQSYIVLAKTVAQRFRLVPELVCAVCEQESGWNPWAVRYEPAFMSRYVAPLYAANKIGATEAWCRAMSFGLMQVMGQVARECGVTLQFLTGLCDPEAGLSIGCTVLAKKLEVAKGDVAEGLLKFNGGSNANYAVQVLARVAKYR
jgi:soluble lytic murein transglycosylase-like protein